MLELIGLINTLGKCTQGLSNFLKKKYSVKKIKVVVAYDCRNQSRNFAHDVADVLTAKEFTAICL